MKNGECNGGEKIILPKDSNNAATEISSQRFIDSVSVGDDSRRRCRRRGSSNSSDTSRRLCHDLKTLEREGGGGGDVVVPEVFSLLKEAVKKRKNT